MKVAIVIDYWKLPIFERHLTRANYLYTQSPGLTPDALFLFVETDAPKALERVVRAANAEAAVAGEGIGNG